MAENETIEEYDVVVNHEEQYSLWPVGRTVPPGWRMAGKKGTKEECLKFIKEVWTDMRPLSLRLPAQELGTTRHDEGNV